MKIVSLNIECDKHYEKFLPFLTKEDPDIICLQEVLEEDLPNLVEKLGNLNYIFKPFKYALSDHPSNKYLYGKRFGNAIFSKNIVNSGYSYYWGDENNCQLPFAEYITKFDQLENYVFIWADIKDSFGKIYRCVTTHFPVTKNGESTPHQLEVLKPFFTKLDKRGDFILCGDFNAPRGNETFSRISSKYKDNIPKKYVTSLDQNLHIIKNLMLMVDGLFTTQNFSATEVHLVDGMSDHMAVVATINKVE